MEGKKVRNYVGKLLTVLPGFFVQMILDNCKDSLELFVPKKVSTVLMIRNFNRSKRIVL